MNLRNELKSQRQKNTHHQPLTPMSSDDDHTTTDNDSDGDGDDGDGPDHEDGGFGSSPVLPEEWQARLAAEPVDDDRVLALIVDHLAFEGHRGALEALATESGCKVPVLLDSVDRRVAARRAVMEGDSLLAIQLLEEVDPWLLHRQPKLHFRLRSQCVLDAICDGLWGEALACALQDLPSLVEAQEALRPDFEAVMALFAFPAPEASPLGHLLSPEHRRGTAEAVNAALLEMEGLQADTGLTGLLRRLKYCQQLVPSCGKNVPPVRLLSDAGLFTGEEP